MRVNLKKLIDDSRKAFRVLDKKSRKALMKFGAYVRRTAQTSMRSKKGSSPPGVPPYAHGRKLLRKLIFFTWDSQRKSMVVGPVLKLDTKNLMVPRTLESGGTVTVNTRRGMVTKQYEKRPYIEPAAAKHRGSVTKWYAEA